MVVDIGGTKTAIGMLLDGSIHMIDTRPTPADPAEALSFISETAANLDGRNTVGAIGIGAPGPLNAKEGTLLQLPNLPLWRGFPLSEALEKEVGLPVRLENDANLGALGEALYGRGRGLSTVFYLTISTGIGSGLIIDGKIHGGRNGLAGELWTFKPSLFSGIGDGRTVMELASGPGLLAQARTQIAAGVPSVLDSEIRDTVRFMEAVMSGDRLAVDIIEKGRDAVAALLTVVIETVSPDIIVLGGGLCTDTDWYVRPIKERIRRWIDVTDLADVPIHRAQLWDIAVLHGAAALVDDLL
jgi:glucokinase